VVTATGLLTSRDKLFIDRVPTRLERLNPEKHKKFGIEIAIFLIGVDKAQEIHLFGVKSTVEQAGN